MCQLDWKYKGSFLTFLNSNDIKVLRKYHGEQCCTVKNGYVFPRSIHGSKIFPIIGYFKEQKQKQDVLKKKEEKKEIDKNNRYNPAL